MRLLSAVLLLLALSVVPASVVRGDNVVIADGAVVDDAAACCRVCRKGKACGDSCIDRDRTCHKPPGCACDAD